MTALFQFVGFAALLLTIFSCGFCTGAFAATVFFDERDE